ncbi:hypothetical protein P9139_04030 [Curtobacterium flaccumfaciens]|nr:hypothetical protein P9139_04030 [Curtobacterium flaccumfaciens]
MPRERLDEPGLGLTGTTWTRVSPKLVWTELVTTTVIGLVVTAGCVLIGVVNGGFGAPPASSGPRSRSWCSSSRRSPPP